MPAPTDTKSKARTSQCPWCDGPKMPQSILCWDCSLSVREFTVPRAEGHHSWKGGDAASTTKRSRLHRATGSVSAICEHKDCVADALDRHHIDGDPGNHRPENIRLLCRYHHMKEDGRLEKARSLCRENAKKNQKPPQPCRICETVTKPLRRGRCHACDMYLRRTGNERSCHLRKSIKSGEV